MKRTGAFTIVEIIIVITVIAILSTLSVITYNSIRQDARDAARHGNATIIGEALEKYYEQNGEYPSVASISNTQPANTGEVVASKLSIPATSLVMPNMPTTATNGITGGSEPTNNYVAYEAISAEDNAACQISQDGGCDQFTLRYLEESTEEVKVIESRHSARATALRPDLELSATGISSISSSWTPVFQATGYELQRSIASDLSSPVTTSHSSATTSASSTGLAPDTEYFFRVRAQLPAGFSDWSDIQSETTTSLAAPTGTITITAAMSGTNARGTAGGGTCPVGATIERQIRYQVNGGSWQAYVIGSTRDVAATEGHTYNFQAQARCKSGAANGPWATSATAAITRPVTAPSGLTISAAIVSTSYARGTAGGGTCASGTTIERQIRYQINANSWVPYATVSSIRDVAATSGYRYTFQQQARCKGANASSSWAASGTASVVRTVAAPTGTLTISAGMSGTDARGTGGGGSCPSGTSIERQIRYANSNVQPNTSYSSWISGSPRTITATNQGYQYKFQQQARCIGNYASSGWIASTSTATTVRPITFVPSRLTVTVSTSGSATTFTSSVNGCPSGTTAYYMYRSSNHGDNIKVGDVAGFNANEWVGGWTSGTTSRTSTWNTSTSNRTYFRDQQTNCRTDFHSGPWVPLDPSTGLQGTAQRYYRP